MKVCLVSKQQSGVMLLESLIAILIFAIGILGIVGLQATAIKQGTDAKYRSDAAMLANQLIGQMWLSDHNATTLQNQFAGTALCNPMPTIPTPYCTWSATVASTLPNVNGVTGTPPSVTFDPSNNGLATIQIQWLSPSEPAGTAPHSYIVVAQIKDLSN